MGRIEKSVTVTVPCEVQCLLSYDEDADGGVRCERVMFVNRPSSESVEQTIVDDEDVYEYYVDMLKESAG